MICVEKENEIELLLLSRLEKFETISSTFPYTFGFI